MNAENPEAERRGLGSVLRGRQVAAILADVLRPATTQQLELDGSDLTEVNAYGAAVLRAAMETHLARNPSQGVSVIEPANSECWAHFSDLLGLPAGQRWSWSGTRSGAARGRNVLIPATIIRDSEDAQLIVDHAIPTAAGALGYGARTGRLLQEAAAVFLDNAEQHARSRPVRPVLCVAFHPPSNDLQLVSANLEDPEDLAVATATHLHDAITRSQLAHGALDDLAGRRRGDLDFTVRLISGTGRARRRSDEAWRVLDEPERFPGFVAGLEVHR